MKSYFLSISFCLLIVFSLTNQSFAQTAYEPIHNDSVLLLAIKNEINQKYIQDSLAITGDNKKELRKIFKERHDYINEMFNQHELFGTAACNEYLNHLVNIILKNNPALQKLGCHFLYSRVFWPNASSLGEGTILFNIGMFTKLSNESQAIFILCHELAHLYMDHSNKAIQQYVNTVYSDEFQKKLRTINRTEYEKNKQLDVLAKGVTFKSRRHSREHESEADSMGLVFMKNTPYDTRESISALALLDDIDKDNFETEKELKALFNFPEFPFKDKWIKKEEAFFGVTADTKEHAQEEDSLKTHPDCKVRIQRLTPTIQSIDHTNSKKFIVDEAAFNKWKTQFDYDMIAYCYETKSLSRCLYYSIKMFSTKKDIAYPATMIGKCLNDMYKYQKKHTLGKYIDLPSPYLDKGYNSFLEFLEKLGLNDFPNLTYYFLKQNEGKFSKDPLFEEVNEESKLNFNTL